MEGTIRRTYESYGFVAIETPAIENLSTLLGKYGEEGDQLLYRLLHRRDKLSRALETGAPTEKDLAEQGLRYDLTVPFARFISNNRDLPRFFKRYQIQPVWRADRPGKGRFREFYQCDVDITGTESLIAETEVCSAVAEVFLNLGFQDFAIHLNHRHLLKCLIAAAGLRPDQEETALVAVDKMDKIGEDGVTKELAARGIAADQAVKLLTILRRDAATTEHQELERLQSILSADPASQKPLGDLKEMLELSQGLPLGKKIRIDATLARGLGYYTGPIFEIRAPDVNGSIGGGGRFDGLIGMFSGKPIPAVGFSIGFERLVMILDEKKLYPPLTIGPDMLICRFPDVSASSALSMAHSFRAQGLKVEVFPETPKVGKQIGYAESIAAPVVAILGSNELAAGSVTLKHLPSGEQVTIPQDQATSKINGWLKKEPLSPA